MPFAFKLKKLGFNSLFLAKIFNLLEKELSKIKNKKKKFLKFLYIFQKFTYILP